MSEYKFGIGEFLTRDGRKAVVLCDDIADYFQLAGYVIADDGDKTLESWTSSGAYQYSGNSKFDLMPPAPAKPEPVECWVNLYQRTDGSLEFGAFAHPSEDESADAARGAPTLIRTIRISSDDEDRFQVGWDAALDAADVDLEDQGWIGPRKVIRALKGKANA